MSEHGKRTKPTNSQEIFNPFTTHKQICVVLQLADRPVNEPLRAFRISQMVLPAISLAKLHPIKLSNGHYLQYVDKEGFSQPSVVVYANETGKVHKEEDLKNWPRFLAGVDEVGYFICLEEDWLKEAK